MDEEGEKSGREMWDSSVIVLEKHFRYFRYILIGFGHRYQLMLCTDRRIDGQMDE